MIEPRSRFLIVWITLFFFLFFLCLPLINTSADLPIRSAIPNELQGRARGIIGLLSKVGYVVGLGLALTALAKLLRDRQSLLLAVQKGANES